MERFDYVLITKGYKEKVRLAGKVYDCEDIFGKEKIDTLYHSKPRKVYAKNQEMASAEVQRSLGTKWTGIRWLHFGEPKVKVNNVKIIEGENQDGR